MGRWHVAAPCGRCSVEAIARAFFLAFLQRGRDTDGAAAADAAGGMSVQISPPARFCIESGAAEDQRWPARASGQWWSRPWQRQQAPASALHCDASCISPSSPAFPASRLCLLRRRRLGRPCSCLESCGVVGGPFVSSRAPGPARGPACARSENKAKP